MSRAFVGAARREGRAGAGPSGPRRERLERYAIRGKLFADCTGGQTEEVYYKLWNLGCDGFSTDYPSVMFRVIRSLKEKVF